jgi:hypothetical protein
MELYKLKRALSRNLAIATLGLSTSFSMLCYNVGTTTSLSEELKETPMTEKSMTEIYIPALNKVQNIQNAAIGVGSASGLYLILGLSIPLAGYAIKKKSLEKQLSSTNL